jgi:hypothetical protein
VKRALRIDAVWGVIFTAGVVGAAACDGEPSCEETQTCPGNAGSVSGKGGNVGQGGSSGSASGGTDGSSGNASGGNGASAGDGGNAGNGNGGGNGASGGESGTGGGDEDPPTVESFAPGDGEADVERDVEVTAELSEPIDEATVTTSSVTLEGPEGEVAGNLSVDQAVIRFVPDRPLHLLGTYTFTLADSIADLAGNTLVASASAEFQVRDGRWGAAAYPFGRTVPRNVTRLERNALGDVVVGMERPDDLEIVYGAVYTAEENRWTPADELHYMMGQQYYPSGLGIDDSRRAVVAWGGYNTAGYGWTRCTAQGTWIDAGPLGAFAELAVTPAGSVMGVTWVGTDPDLVLRAQDLATGTVEAAAPFPTLDSAEFVFPVASLERIALLSASNVSGGQELTVRWQAGVGWGAPDALATATEFSAFTFDEDEQGNIIVIWRDVDVIRSRVYERAKNQWTPLALVATTTTSAFLNKPDMTAGSAVFSFNASDPDPATWAAVYEAGVGWNEDSFLRLGDNESGGLVAVSMDGAGNALAAWDGTFRYRRYLPGTGWRAASSLVSVGVFTSHIWAAAALDGAVLVVSNDFASPWSIRFE